MVNNQEYFFLTQPVHLSLIQSHVRSVFKNKIEGLEYENVLLISDNFFLLFIASHGPPSLAVWLQPSPLLTSTRKLFWNSSTEGKSWKGALGFNTTFLTTQLQRRFAMCTWTLSKTPQMTPHMQSEACVTWPLFQSCKAEPYLKASCKLYH